MPWRVQARLRCLEIAKALPAVNAASATELARTAAQLEIYALSGIPVEWADLAGNG